MPYTAKTKYREFETNIPKEKELHGLSVPVSTFMCLWAIYIFPRLVCLLCCRKICGPILGICKSLTDTWIRKFGLRPRAIPLLGIHNGIPLQCIRKHPSAFIIMSSIRVSPPSFGRYCTLQEKETCWRSLNPPFSPPPAQAFPWPSYPPPLSRPWLGREPLFFYIIFLLHRIYNLNKLLFNQALESSFQIVFEGQCLRTICMEGSNLVTFTYRVRRSFSLNAKRCEKEAKLITFICFWLERKSRCEKKRKTQNLSPLFCFAFGWSEKIEVNISIDQALKIDTFLGPEWQSPDGSMPFQRAQKSHDFHRPNPLQLAPVMDLPSSKALRTGPYKSLVHK